MTQRQAVFVGCRLIAVYLVAEGAIAVGGSLLSMGVMTSFMAGAGGRNIPMPTPWDALIKTVVIQAVVRGGIAIMLWAAAAKLSRMAADPVDGDDGWHGD